MDCPTGNHLPVDERPLGALKALQREQHLCLKCDHHLVCGIAKALDPNLLVTISSCLAFQSAEQGGPEDGHAS